jgi:hypothetical protein
MGEAIEEIRVTGIHIGEILLADARKILIEKGYDCYLSPRPQHLKSRTKDLNMIESGTQ